MSLTWVELWGFEPQTSCMPSAASESEQVRRSRAGSHPPAGTLLTPSGTVRLGLNTLAPDSGSQNPARPGTILDIEHSVEIYVPSANSVLKAPSTHGLQKGKPPNSGRFGMAYCN
jgi:hypothetical protein